MEGMNIMPLVVGWRDVGDDAMAAALYHTPSTQLIGGPFYICGWGGAAGEDDAPKTT